MRIFISLILLLTSYSALADIIWTDVQGYSKLQQWNINNNQGVIVLGGFGGADCVGATDTSTCDNCNASFAVCNKTRAYPSLVLQVTFASTEKAGVPRITTLNTAGTNDPISGQVLSIAATTATNQSVTIRVPWSQLCAKINDDNDPTCNVSLSKVYKIGIDGNSDGDLEDGSDDDAVSFTLVANKPTAFSEASATDTSKQKGIYDFSLFPGDEKAYIENIKINSAAERPVVAVHFLCQDTSYASIVASDICATVSVTNNALDKDFITGLSNGTEYFFHAASEDDTGNIGLYLREEDNNCPPGALINSRCRAVTPSAVGGLFKDNCFIATAAYGSIMEPQVRTLRSFRDKYLLNNTFGKAFVRSYYKYSPAMADWISVSENRRAMTRIALAPVVFSVGAFMHSPQLCAMGFLVFVFFILFSVYRKNLQPVLRRDRK